MTYVRIWVKARWNYFADNLTAGTRKVFQGEEVTPFPRPK